MPDRPCKHSLLALSDFHDEGSALYECVVCGEVDPVRERVKIDLLRIIEFDERPALDHATASEQLEHLYVHMGLVQEKVNELIAVSNTGSEPRT